MRISLRLSPGHGPAGGGGGGMRAWKPIKIRQFSIRYMSNKGNKLFDIVQPTEGTLTLSVFHLKETLDKEKAAVYLLQTFQLNLLDGSIGLDTTPITGKFESEVILSRIECAKNQREAIELMLAELNEIKDDYEPAKDPDKPVELNFAILTKLIKGIGDNL